MAVFLVNHVIKILSCYQDCLGRFIAVQVGVIYGQVFREIDFVFSKETYHGLFVVL